MRPSFTGLYASEPRGRRVRVYLPDMPGPHPTVVLVPGLAVPGGGGPAVRPLRRFLLDAGHAVVLFDRRVLFAGAVDDARAALRWVSAEAAAFELDPERISVVGLGLGAAVAAVAADAPYRLVGFYGPYDFARLTRAAAWLLLGDTDPARLAWRSPVNACRTRSPTLLLHGTHDRLVPVGHAERMVATRTERGLPVQLRLFPGAGHGFLDHAGLNLWDEAAGELLAFLLETGPDRTSPAHK